MFKKIGNLMCLILTYDNLSLRRELGIGTTVDLILIEKKAYKIWQEDFELRACILPMLKEGCKIEIF